MMFLSIALVIIACIAGWLVNKYLDKKFQISSNAAEAATVAALEERINKFDQRINDTWGSISSTKQEFEAFKLAIGLKGMK
jgi:hypothetical protein